MKTTSPALATLEQHYDRLRQSLAQIGYISQGSVLARSVATSGRSGYQWTRKVAQKNHHRFVKSLPVRGDEGGHPKREKTVEYDPADGEGLPPNPLRIPTRYASA